MSDRALGLHVRARSGPGVLRQLSGVIARHRGDITSVEIVERTPEESRVYFDTIPLVGEKTLAEAVRAVVRLPRARPRVLAGSLMGGEIEAAVREVRARGLLDISLNMAGSVPDAADLVVADPVQAGVMAVLAVADTAKFSPSRLKRRVF